MTSNLPPYLQSSLDVANALPMRLDGVPVEDVELIQKRLRDLVDLVANRDGQIAKLTERLTIITRIAIDNIDLDAPKAREFSEIVGVAEGDANWLQHAIANYEIKHQRLVTLALSLLDGALDSFGDDGCINDVSKRRAAEQMADQIEQEILPEMFLAEDGRNFLRSQGQPYPRVEVADGKA